MIGRYAVTTYHDRYAVVYDNCLLRWDDGDVRQFRRLSDAEHVAKRLSSLERRYPHLRLIPERWTGPGTREEG